MPEPSPLTLQFLDWVASGRRSRADLMATWQSSCPRLSIWEDALLAGLARYAHDTRTIELTPEGYSALGREFRKAAE